MKNMIFTNCVSSYDTMKEKLVESNHCLSIPYVEKTIYKDEDLTNVDMMIEDNTRRCNKYDGLICLNMLKIEIPTSEFIDYFIEFINYYADSATVLILGNEMTINKISSHKDLKYVCLKYIEKEADQHDKTLY